MAEGSDYNNENCHIHYSPSTNIFIMQIPLILAVTAILGAMAYPGHVNTVRTASVLYEHLVVC